MRYDICLFDQGDVVSFENDDDDAQEEVGVEYDDGDGEGPRPLFIMCLPPSPPLARVTLDLTGSSLSLKSQSHKR